MKHFVYKTTSKTTIKQFNNAITENCHYQKKATM